MSKKNLYSKRINNKREGDIGGEKVNKPILVIVTTASTIVSSMFRNPFVPTTALTSRLK